jgi:hypothetical protein
MIFTINDIYNKVNVIHSLNNLFYNNLSNIKKILNIGNLDDFKNEDKKKNKIIMILLSLIFLLIIILIFIIIFKK